MILMVACGTPSTPVTPDGSGGLNAESQRNKPYLLLVSIDGFRWDYMSRYPTPNMDRVAAKGSTAERLLPVFPTLTFPNHYSIATGLYPQHHGIVANDFPDPARATWYSLKNRETVQDQGFYGGEPIWVTAETQGMVTAAYFFVGTEAPVMGVPPTYWRDFDNDIPGEDRVDQVLSWLAKPEESRPHMYTLYFEDVDDYSHWKGPDSPESIKAISRVDAYLGRLLDGIQKLSFADQINIILVSDHGQAAYNEKPQLLVLEDYVNLDNTHIIEGGSYLFIHFEEDDPARAQAMVDVVNDNWDHGQAYVPSTLPPHWQVGDNPRFPDVILISETGDAVISRSEKRHKVSAGDHGWSPESPEMHGFFVASGPNIRPGVTLGPVRNIDVYPLMVSILGLKGAEELDGDARLADKLYRPK